ncbi:MAG: glycosyltransferase family 2 protein [Alphaproteobacteria bacterium]|nr:glycosyltransferase family 2 protein [Alphaproteobacteria bacterium]
MTPSPHSIPASSAPRSAARPALSAVVPCFNEEDCLTRLHERLSAACREAVGEDYEIVLVNDGSRDRTWELISSFAARDPHVVGVDLSRNHGHQLALTAGLNVCRGDRIFIIDADLQDPPELLSEMMAAMDRGADVAYGQRRQREGESAFKKGTALLFYRLLRRLSDVDIPVDTGDFRLMSRKALDVLIDMPEQFRFIRGMVAWIGMEQVAIPYDRDQRFAGSTKYPLRRMISFALDAITSFSRRPLRIASLLGIAFGIIGLLLVLYTFYSWVAYETVEGWASLMTVVVVMGSVQLIMIGILGEYLGRLYMESKQRPLFVIREVVGHKATGTLSDPQIQERPAAAHGASQ